MTQLGDSLRIPNGRAGVAKLSRALSIEPGEGARTALLFTLLFVASMVFVLGRTARDALFLTRYPFSWIAYMWVGYGLVASVVALGYGWLSSRVARKPFVSFFVAGAALSYLGVRLALALGVNWAVALFYIWAEVIANLIVVQAWTITNDLHDARSAKRLFGWIGLGRAVGMSAAGLATGALVRFLGTANLLVVIAALMLVFVGLVHLVSRRWPLPKASSSQATAADTQTPSRRTGYTVAISALLLLAFMALTVGDYQFKAIAKLSYPRTDDLAAYMAFFYAGLGLVAFVFQVFVSPRILKRLGVLAGLLAMPMAFASSTAMLFGAPVLATATLLKLSDNGLQYTIHDATMQLLYFAFPTAQRGKVRAALDAAVKPLGYSIGGLLLIAVTPAPLLGESAAQFAGRVAHVGVVSLVLCAAWIVVAPIVRSAYVDALRKSLLRRESDVSDETDLPADSSVRQLLTETLHTEDAGKVAFAAERLAISDADALRAELPKLASHGQASIRALALRYAAQLGHPAAAQLARKALESDSDAQVQSAAIAALGAVCAEESLDELSPYVSNDSRPALRDSAMAALIAHGGLSGMLVGGARLQELVRSPVESDREGAARTFALVGQPALARNLRPLLSDPSRKVRRAAVTATSRCVSPALAPALLDCMGDRALIKLAIESLASMGSAILPVLEARLSHRDPPRLARLHIPRVLHRIGSPEALAVLLRNLRDEDEGVRQKVLASASRLMLELRARPLSAEEVRPWIVSELADHRGLREGYAAARNWLGRPLVDAQIKLELRGHIVRVMRTCELAFSRAHVAAARGAIFSKDPARRANALEVLDNVLDSTTREAVLDCVSRFPAAVAYSGPPQVPGELAPDDVVRWFSARCALPGAYRRAVLFEAVGVHGVRNLAPMAFDYVQSDTPFLRENALIALAACRPQGWREAIEKSANEDTCPVVRAYAKYVIERDSAGLDPEDDMYTTVEKILFLQGVPLFATVPGNELMPLARLATIVRFPAGATIFKKGDPGDCLYVVVHGAVEIRAGSRQLARLGVGEVFGEMAILDEEPRSADAVAAEDLDLLRLSAEDFHQALEDTAEIAAGVIRVLSRRIREAAPPAGESC